MQTLKLSVSLPDATHPDMELRLSANDSACDVVITFPAQSSRATPAVQALSSEAISSECDDYVLGGYAGI